MASESLWPRSVHSIAEVAVVDPRIATPELLSAQGTMSAEAMGSTITPALSAVVVLADSM